MSDTPIISVPAPEEPTVIKVVVPGIQGPAGPQGERGPEGTSDAAIPLAQIATAHVNMSTLIIKLVTGQLKVTE